MMTAPVFPRHTRARRGFTLVELVVVLVIIATLAAVAVPRYASADSGFRAQGAAERLADAVRDAQATARARGTAVEVRVTAASDTVTISVISPIEFLAMFSSDERPFYADIRSTAIATGTRLRVNGHGEFSTSAIYLVGVGTREKAVIVNGPAGTVSVASKDEAETFRASGDYR